MSKSMFGAIFCALCVLIGSNNLVLLSAWFPQPDYHVAPITVISVLAGYGFMSAVRVLFLDWGPFKQSHD
jgi:hypothetical protein